MARDFTDAELQEVAAFVAYRYLEVERGLRDKNCLQRYLTPDAYTKQFDSAASRFAKGGVVRQRDLGRMSFQRPEPNRAHVAIPARQEGDRWGALVMELRSNHRGIWRVTELTRAQDRNLTRAQPVPRWKGPEDPDLALVQLAHTTVSARNARTGAAERYARAREELVRVAPEKPAGELGPGDLVNTGSLHRQRWAEVRSISADEATGDVTLRAADGTQLRLPAERAVLVLMVRNGDLDAARQDAAVAARGFDAAAEELAHWDRQLDLLNDEGIRLMQARSVGQRIDVPDEHPELPGYLTRTLGSPPQDTAARELWDAAAAAIETYRDRWGVSRTDCALGLQPHEPEQRKDRDSTITTLRELTAQLPAAGRDRDDGRGQRVAAEHDKVGRAPFAVTIPGGQP